MAFESLPWVYIHFALSRSPQHEFPAPRPPWLLWDHLACWLDTEAGLWWPNSLELFHRSLVTAERFTKKHTMHGMEMFVFFFKRIFCRKTIRRNNNKVGCEILFQRLMPNFEMMMKWWPVWWMKNHTSKLYRFEYCKKGMEATQTSKSDPV